MIVVKRCFVILIYIIIASIFIINFYTYKKLSLLTDSMHGETEVIIDETVNLEGEEVVIQTKEYNSPLGYIIRYDINLYEIVSTNKCDVFKTDNKEVYFTICEVKEIDDINDLEVYKIGDNTYNSRHLVEDGFKIDKYYIEYKDKYLLIETHYPNSSEYIEGYGARILNTINSFTLDK